MGKAIKEIKGKTLTVEELKSLKVGDWVWLVADKAEGYAYKLEPGLCTPEREWLVLKTFYNFRRVLNYENYGIKWVAYKTQEDAQSKAEVSFNDFNNSINSVLTILNNLFPSQINHSDYSQLFKTISELPHAVANMLHGRSAESIKQLREQISKLTVYEAGSTGIECVSLNEIDHIIDKILNKGDQNQ